MKFEMLDPVCDRARKLLGKSDLFPHLRTNPSLGKHIIYSLSLAKPVHRVPRGCKKSNW